MLAFRTLPAPKHDDVSLDEAESLVANNRIGIVSPSPLLADYLFCHLSHVTVV